MALHPLLCFVSFFAWCSPLCIRISKYNNIKNIGLKNTVDTSTRRHVDKTGENAVISRVLGVDIYLKQRRQVDKTEQRVVK